MKNNIELNSCALDMRKILKEDLQSPIDIFSLINNLKDVTLVFYPMSERISGMCIKQSNIKVIAINSNMSYGRQRFTVAHELYHLLSGDIYNKCLEEGITSLINYEYSDYENQDSYYKQLLIAQILCEIIDPELVVKSYLQADTSIITDELFKIDNNKTRYKRLFKNLSRYQEVFNEYLEYTEVDLEKGSYNDYLNLKNIEEDLLKSIKSDLKFYYDHSKNRKDEATVEDYFDKLTTDYDIVVNSNNNKNKIVYMGDYNTESKYLRKTK